MTAIGGCVTVRNASARALDPVLDQTAVLRVPSRARDMADDGAYRPVTDATSSAD